MHIANFVTDFADQAVMLPLAVAVALVLALMGWARGAAAWVLSAACTWGAMLALKLVGMDCGSLLFGPELTTPSGHTATAAFVYGGLAAVIINKRVGRLDWAVPCSLAVAVVIGASRLVIGAHSVPEVLVGGAVGVAGAFAFVHVAGPPPEAKRLRWAACLAALIMAAVHGIHLPAEQAIHTLAGNIWPLSLCVQAKTGPSAHQALHAALDVVRQPFKLVE